MRIRSVSLAAIVVATGFGFAAAPAFAQPMPMPAAPAAPPPAQPAIELVPATPAPMAEPPPVAAMPAEPGTPARLAEEMERMREMMTLRLMGPNDGGGMAADLRATAMAQFQAMDANGDGKVSQEEFEAGWLSVFLLLDQNADGFLDAADREIVAARRAAEAAEAGAGETRIVIERGAEEGRGAEADRLGEDRGGGGYFEYRRGNEGGAGQFEFRRGDDGGRGEFEFRRGGDDHDGWHGQWQYGHGGPAYFFFQFPGGGMQFFMMPGMGMMMPGMGGQHGGGMMMPYFGGQHGGGMVMPGMPVGPGGMPGFPGMPFGEGMPGGPNIQIQPLPGPGMGGWQYFGGQEFRDGPPPIDRPNERANPKSPKP